MPKKFLRALIISILDLGFCYNILHVLCAVSLPVELSCSNTRGNNLKLAKHFCYNDACKYFFNNRVVDAWNSLSNNVVLSPSTGIFKKSIRMVNLDRFVTIFQKLIHACYTL